jgi:hypothetical protein
MTEEARLQRLEDHLADVIELLNGGTRTSWERSIRGRLHAMAADVSALKMVEERRMASHSQRWTRGEKLLGGVLALATLSIQFATLLLAVGHG